MINSIFWAFVLGVLLALSFGELVAYANARPEHGSLEMRVTALEQRVQELRQQVKELREKQ